MTALVPYVAIVSAVSNSRVVYAVDIKARALYREFLSPNLPCPRPAFASFVHQDRATPDWVLLSAPDAKIWMYLVYLKYWPNI